jgi:hypothetical protein
VKEETAEGIPTMEDPAKDAEMKDEGKDAEAKAM